MSGSDVETRHPGAAGDRRVAVAGGRRDEPLPEPERRGRNGRLLVVPLVLLVAVASIAGAVALGSSGDEPADSTAAEPDVRAVEVPEAPSIEELVADIEVPVADLPLAVVDKGVTVVPSQFDQDTREATFAAVAENPNVGWLARGVEVSVSLVTAGGALVDAGPTFVEVILPGQRVAVTGLVFEAPEAEVVDIVVETGVARWQETGPVSGELLISEVASAPAEYSGIRTTFTLESTFDQDLRDVAVSAVHYDRTGRIIGGYDTFVDRVEPGRPVEAQVDLLTNLGIEDVAATELFPVVGFGFVPTGSVGVPDR